METGGLEAVGAGGSKLGGEGGTPGAGGTGGVPNMGGTGAGKTGGTSGAVATGGSGGSNSGGVGVSETWLVSENFESGKIDLAKWTAPYMTDGAILAVQSNQVAHGKYAMRIDVPGVRPNGGDNANAQITLKAKPPALTGHVFLRVYVRFSPAPDYKTILYKSEGGHTEFGTYSSGGPRFAVEVTGSSDAGSGPVVADKWLCVEVEWETGPYRMTLYVDGKSYYSRTGNAAPGFVDITIGYQSGHAAHYNSAIFIDDFAMDTQRIHCL